MSLRRHTVSNTSLAEGYECIPFYPHTMLHTNPAPVLTFTNVVYDGTLVVVTGNVNHLHPDEITVRADKGENTSQATTQPNLNGAWSLTIESTTSKIYINITASHDLEQTFSETTLVEITRTSSEETNQSNNNTDNGNDNNAHNNTDNQTNNSTGNGTDNETGNNNDNGTDNNTGNNSGNQTDNGTDDPAGPNQPTYDPSDMGQFWLDVFRCQAGQTSHRSTTYPLRQLKHTNVR